ncbi:MAG: hypothetical protein ACU836_18610 [Gammaproteobacteria bacterium]
MTLQRHLSSRIAMVVVLCLLFTACYVLHQSHLRSELAGKQMAESLVKQLVSQLPLRKAGIGQANPFPDFDTWKLTESRPGVCIAYADSDGSRFRQLCIGTKPSEREWPALIESVYRWLFHPGQQMARAVELNGRIYGAVTITPNIESEIGEAWTQSVNRALKPAHIIVHGLEQLEAGRLAYRLPAFKLKEWQSISIAVNQMAASQQQLLEQRQRLVCENDAFAGTGT